MKAEQVTDHTVILGPLGNSPHPIKNTPLLLNNILTLLEPEAVPFAFSFDGQNKARKHNPFLTSFQRWHTAWDSEASSKGLFQSNYSK